MRWFLFAALVFAPVSAAGAPRDLPSTEVDVSVVHANAERVFDALGSLAARPIDARCLRGRTVDLHLERASVPIVFDALAADLGLRYREDGNEVVVECVDFTPIAAERLGMRLTPMTEGLRMFFGAPLESGLLVAEVIPPGPAALTGLRAGDVLLEFNGQTTGDIAALERALGRIERSRFIEIVFLRERRSVRTRIAINHDDQSNLQLQRWVREGELESLGYPLTPPPPGYQPPLFNPWFSIP